MGYNPRDHFFKKAKQENFAARSVFKLKEIDEKYKILRRGQQVLDLGCAPGSWSQYCSQRVGSEGRVVGIDLTAVELKLSNVNFVQDNLYHWDLEKFALDLDLVPRFDIVLSDMAPKTTGIRVTDQARSLDLCELALGYAEKYLRKNGHFVCKLFHSDDFGPLREKMKSQFSRFEALKPDSTRKISKEIFLIGLQKK